jgi:enoyl-[acyl-carrier protein] reductase II
LVAAVSSAGGLGILAPGLVSPEEIRENIRAVREQTDKPFGVSVVAGSPGYQELAQVMIEEKVPVICHGRGNPKWLIDAAKGHGIIIMALIGTVRHAVRAEEDGADVVVAAGMEAGGHVSHVSTMVLLPLVASKVKIPVVAAGGFCDGRGLVAALALGAEGVAMGTRFAVTQESAMPSNIKQRYVASSEMDTVVTHAITGTRLRVISNKLTELLGEEKEGLSWKERIFSTLETRRMLGIPWWRFLVSGWRMRKAYETSFSGLSIVAAGAMRVYKALVEGDAEFGAMPCGQICGRINDIPGTQEVIERIVSEASRIMEPLVDKVRFEVRTQGRGSIL